MVENKPRINVTVEKTLIDWIDKEIDSHLFANRSHAVEACLAWYKQFRETGQLPPK